MGCHMRKIKKEVALNLRIFMPLVRKGGISPLQALFFVFVAVIGRAIVK